MKEIDPLQKPDTLLFKPKALPQICQIAIPFLYLYRPTALATACGLGAYQVYQIGRGNPTELVKVTTALGLGIFQPRLGLLFSRGVELVSVVREGHEKGPLLAQALTDFLDIGAMFWGRPELVAASLLLQALKEVRKSKTEFDDGNYPEAIANLALALIRLHGAAPHLKDIHREHWGKEVTQEVFDEFIQGDRPLSERLKEGHYRSHIKGIKAKGREFVGKRFDKLHFEGCDFDETNFKRASFDRVTLTNCSAKAARFTYSRWTHSTWEGGSAAQSYFDRALLRETIWRGADLTGVQFYAATLEESLFERSNLTASSFLLANAQDVHLDHCDLYDTILGDQRANFKISGPIPQGPQKSVVALSWDFENPQTFAGYQKEGLVQKGVVCALYEHFPEEVDPNKLEQEVEALLSEIEQEAGPGTNIARTLLDKGVTGELARLKGQAARIVNSVDLVELPGGANIEPELYGQRRGPHIGTEGDWRRSIIELGTLAEAERMRKPVLGICRGNQMINVWHGGTLKNVEGQWGVFQDLEVSGPGLAADRMREIVGDRFQAYSCHHQAIDQLGEGLELVVSWEGIPKAVMTDDGRVLGTQFHPELESAIPYEWLAFRFPHLSPELFSKNGKIFEYFVGTCSRG